MVEKQFIEPKFLEKKYFGGISSLKFIYRPKMDIFLKMMPYEQFSLKKEHFFIVRIRFYETFGSRKTVYEAQVLNFFQFNGISSSKLIF